ncbi:hypothetical protein [Robiginitalea sediminis]|uniref:hypothetical protein n=1 Tax=Robiginitalea sediminis TaxID=1982593 RepID=UPI000B4BB0E1|nr:hypothetical protein [Robiginitalea sediminis]
MDALPTREAFWQSLKQDDGPNPGWPDSLRALWYDGNGNWEASHDIAQEMPGNLGSWIHAYLHRKEGDRWNAGYWYSRAGRPFPEIGLEEEFRLLVAHVLS